jgi:hypothetical protein
VVRRRRPACFGPGVFTLLVRPGRQTGVPFAYVRLLADREAIDALAPTLGHIVTDRGAEVEADARAIRVLRQRVPVVAFVNNHYAGYAPETVRQLAAQTDATISA